jgi:outer membrane protein
MKSLPCTGIIMAVIAVCAASSGAYAGEAKKISAISVDRAVQIAFQNNQDFKIARERLKAADEKINGVWGQLMPVLESEASMLRQGADSGPLSMSDGQYDIKIVQMRFGINPGYFYNSLKASRSSYIIAREELKKIRTDIEYSVVKGYFDLLLAEEVVKMRKDSLSLLRENLKDVENMYKTGTVPKFELLQAQVQLKSQEPLLYEAENNYRTALDIFNFHLGLDESAYAADAAILNAGEYRTPAGKPDDITVRLTGIALKNRPEVVQVEMSRDAAKHARNVYSSFYIWPTFSIGGYYGKTKYMPNAVNAPLSTPMGPITPDFSQISGTSDWQSTWQVRVAATYRWGSWIPADQTRAMEREEEAKIREANESLTKLRRQISISIRSGCARLFTSGMTIKSQKENVERAKEGLRIARESYRAGVIKNSELLSAELSLTSAKTACITAIHDYYVSLGELKRETGTDDEKTIFGEVIK